MDTEIKELKRQYKYLDDEIKKEVDNLIKMLQTMPVEYINLSDMANNIEGLIIHRDSIKSSLIAKRAF